MTYRFEHDPQSGAFYIRVREGKYRETIPLAEPGFGAGVDVDAEGNILGFEFLSFEEYAELLARHGGMLEIPNVVKDAEPLPSREERRDEESHQDTTDRIDEVINVSGHRLSAVEIENALQGYEGVAEAAVIGRRHDTKGEEPIGFVTLEQDTEYSEDLMDNMRDHVGNVMGDIAKPGQVIAVDDLPKTYSGKIMRRLLKNIAEGEELGDISALDDPSNAPSIAGIIRQWPRDKNA